MRTVAIKWTVVTLAYMLLHDQIVALNPTTSPKCATGTEASFRATHYILLR